MEFTVSVSDELASQIMESFNLSEAQMGRYLQQRVDELFEYDTGIGSDFELFLEDALDGEN